MVSQKASAVKRAQQSEAQPHQLGQEVFKTIWSEDVDWKPFPALPRPSGWPSSWVSLRSPALTRSWSKRPTARS
jgi:hypothetical protein